MKTPAPGARVTRPGIRKRLPPAESFVLLSDVAGTGGPQPALTVRLIGKRVYSTRIDPAIVEVEQCAHGDGIVNSFVIPAHRVQGLHVLGGNLGRVVIHFVDKAKERLLGLGDGRSAVIFQNSRNLPGITQ